MAQGTTVKVAGPLIVAENMADARMYDVVRVSRDRLVGEIIELRGDKRVHPGVRGNRRAWAPASPWNPPARRFPWNWGRA